MNKNKLFLASLAISISSLTSGCGEGDGKVSSNNPGASEPSAPSQPAASNEVNLNVSGLVWGEDNSSRITGTCGEDFEGQTLMLFKQGGASLGRISCASGQVSVDSSDGEVRLLSETNSAQSINMLVCQTTDTLCESPIETTQVSISEKVIDFYRKDDALSPFESGVTQVILRRQDNNSPLVVMKTSLSNLGTYSFSGADSSDVPVLSVRSIEGGTSFRIVNRPSTSYTALPSKIKLIVSDQRFGGQAQEGVAKAFEGADYDKVVRIESLQILNSSGSTTVTDILTPTYPSGLLSRVGNGTSLPIGVNVTTRNAPNLYALYARSDTCTAMGCTAPTSDGLINSRAIKVTGNYINASAINIPDYRRFFLVMMPPSFSADTIDIDSSNKDNFFLNMEVMDVALTRNSGVATYAMIINDMTPGGVVSIKYNSPNHESLSLSGNVNGRTFGGFSSEILNNGSTLLSPLNDSERYSFMSTLPTTVSTGLALSLTSPIATIVDGGSVTLPVSAAFYLNEVNGDVDNGSGGRILNYSYISGAWLTSMHAYVNDTICTSDGTNPSALNTGPGSFELSTFKDCVLANYSPGVSMEFKVRATAGTLTFDIFKKRFTLP